MNGKKKRLSIAGVATWGALAGGVWFAAFALQAAGPVAERVATSEIIMKEVMVQEQRSGAWSPELSMAERETLFDIADDTLAWCVAGGKGDFDYSSYALTEKLKTPLATFVTLKKGGMLRGCIGSLAPVAPLYESVHDNAVNAALRDPRFPPVRETERAGLDIHISILSPIVAIDSLDAFKLGEHGIILEKGFQRAVYLPEVAIEQGWTVEETLSSLSQKAGLPPDGWRSGAAFKVFSSVVLSKQ